LPSNIDLRAYYDAEGMPWITGDPTQIQQVVLNLAINARDAMPQGGTLEIDVSARENSRPGAGLACLAVRDSGQGMSPDLQGRIFEPFFTTKPAGQGTGLGLSIVHGIVRDHDGRIEVQSVLGRGSTFTLTFPAVTPTSESTDLASDRTLPQGKGELILLADGYTYVREIVSSMLVTLGYRVIQSPDGAGLLTSYERHRGEVRLIIVDADMSGVTGVDCVQKIRTQGGQTPAIVITGNEGAAVELPSTRVLRKPFQMNELAAVVSESLTYHGV
jgi:CheY-like chemotaxis protein